MVDLEKRLREYRPESEWGPVHHVICDEAADTIATLRAEVERKDAALQQIELLSTNCGGWFEHDAFDWGLKMGRIARAALGGTDA